MEDVSPIRGTYKGLPPNLVQRGPEEGFRGCQRVGLIWFCKDGAERCALGWGTTQDGGNWRNRGRTDENGSFLPGLLAHTFHPTKPSSDPSLPSRESGARGLRDEGPAVGGLRDPGPTPSSPGLASCRRTGLCAASRSSSRCPTCSHATPARRPGRSLSLRSSPRTSPGPPVPLFPEPRPLLPRFLRTALFTETPHDMTARTGEDVEMACSFRGSGSPSYSLEIQWWYLRSHRDWTDKQGWASNQLKASQQEDAGKDATKISVVKVVGSNISHKLRLSRVKPTDEGTYECRVIDFSDGKARHHKVKAYLRVQPGENSVLHLPEAPPAAPAPPPPKPGKELRKRSVDEEACSL
ncbi:V-set and transmembrane domain-containing protein 2-like protein [Physeter macrocephalus]|uniref:V-set and transmembrane domain-containing protein 2-like protein n=1 Tax=Physeter macrocephalus TaxID=9755 RepID=A0A455C3R5_PHYMC|nr:V-set and transmembrane domain-containing protein 2-like protein [Physeter catodon]|eukprot:XP_028355677.1 V-set and transmembrane domain-containing protein 2-like protein [Physeter catodon]